MFISDLPCMFTHSICEHESLPRFIPHSTVLPGEHSPNALENRFNHGPTQRNCSASCPRWPIHGLGLRDTRCIIQVGGLATWRKSCVRMAYTSPPNRRYVLLVAAAFSPPRLSHRRYSMCFSSSSIHAETSCDDSFHQPQDSRSRSASPHVVRTR